MEGTAIATATASAASDSAAISTTIVTYHLERITPEITRWLAANSTISLPIRTDHPHLPTTFRRTVSTFLRYLPWFWRQLERLGVRLPELDHYLTQPYYLLPLAVVEVLIRSCARLYTVLFQLPVRYFIGVLRNGFIASRQDLAGQEIVIGLISIASIAICLYLLVHRPINQL